MEKFVLTNHPLPEVGWHGERVIVSDELVQPASIIRDARTMLCFESVLAALSTAPILPETFPKELIAFVRVAVASNSWCIATGGCGMEKLVHPVELDWRKYIYEQPVNLGCGLFARWGIANSPQHMERFNLPGAYAVGVTTEPNSL